MRQHKNVPEMLRMLPAFSSLNESQIAAVLPFVQRRSIPARTGIIRAGEEAAGLYILCSGRVLVLAEDLEGREFVLAAVGPNDFFAELGVFGSGYCTATVRSREACEVLFIPRSIALKCLEGNARAAMCMLRAIAARLADAQRKMAALALTNVYGRVADTLLANTRQFEGEWLVDIGSEDIATMVGASREMVSRVLKDMIQKGVARRYKRKLILVDHERIALRASKICSLTRPQLKQKHPGTRHDASPFG